jgi:hypothetical protein
MRTLIAIGFLFVLANVAPLKANTTVKQYRNELVSSNISTVHFAKIYIYGLGEGFLFANFEAKEKNTPLFCQPAKLSLTMDNYVEMLDQKIAELSKRISEAQLDDLTIAPLLLLALEETFPCTGK